MPQPVHIVERTHHKLPKHMRVLTLWLNYGRIDLQKKRSLDFVSIFFYKFIKENYSSLNASEKIHYSSLLSVVEILIQYFFIFSSIQIGPCQETQRMLACILS